MLLLLATPAFGEYQAGLDAYQDGDYTTAMAEWKEEVNRPGDIQNLAIYRESLYAIAMLYWHGEGVPQDYDIATVWLKQAADINHPGAQTKLGYLYSMGQGVPQNYEIAQEWFQLAAAQGDEDAQHNLDILTHEGMVTPNSAVGGRHTGDPVEDRHAADHGEPWILQRNPDFYTIQVIALSNPKNLHTFIEENPKWSPFAIYRQPRFEYPLWIMVQGDYPDAETARKAVQAFPPGIQERGDLWIRRFGMIQRLIE